MAWTKLITITLPPGHGWPKKQNLAYQAEHIRSLLTTLRRQFGRFRYAWVREVGRKKTWEQDNIECCCHPDLADCICGAGGNRLHAHMLVDIPKWIDRRWLQAHAHACSLGWVDVRAIRGFSAVGYVVKYLGKGWSYPLPDKTRRLQTCGVDALETQPGWRYTAHSIEFACVELLGALYVDCGIYYWSADDAARDCGLDTG